MQLDLFEQTETKAVKLNAKQQELFAVFQRSASDLTANEAAQIAKRRFLDKTMPETYRKRAHELVKKGLIEKTMRRRCWETGQICQAYRLANG
jgi:hypothetical protein